MSREISIFSWDVHKLQKPKKMWDPDVLGSTLGLLVQITDHQGEGGSLYGIVLAEAIFFDDSHPYLFAYWMDSVQEATHAFYGLTQDLVNEELPSEGGGEHIFGIGLSSLEDINDPDHFRVIVRERHVMPNGVVLPVGSIPNGYSVELLK